MKRAHTIFSKCCAQQPVLRFRRWSRKRYAAFISRKQVVTIGHLSAHIADRFLEKNLSLHTASSCSEKSVAYGAMTIRELTEKITDLLKDIASVWASWTVLSMREQTVTCHQAHTTYFTDHYSL